MNLCRNFCQILIINIGCLLGVTENTILEDVVLPIIAGNRICYKCSRAIMFITVSNEVTRLFLFVTSLTHLVYDS